MSYWQLMHSRLFYYLRLKSFKASVLNIIVTYETSWGIPLNKLDEQLNTPEELQLLDSMHIT